MGETKRLGILGCGTIGGYVLDAVVNGTVKNTEVAVVCGRTERSKGRDRVLGCGIKWVTQVEEMMDADLDVIIEAASHEALERNGVRILKNGIDLIPASLGALVDERLLGNLIDAAESAGSILYIPSGGIGGLDAVQAVVHHEVREITLTTRKPPVAWKGIPYVDAMNLNLDGMTEPTVLFEGAAKDCVKKFPQNINIAAALSLAGTGFSATRIRILADPTVERNTHTIFCRSSAGQFTITLENVPVPENPKTTYMACLSVLAALKNLRSTYRIGT